MAKKIKKSEARLLVFLDQAEKHRKYKSHMAAKYDMGYGYISRILNGMYHKGWVNTIRSRSTNKLFYDLTEIGREQLDLARVRLLT